VQPPVVSSARARMQLERGRRWEAAAAQYLEERGLRVIARSYRCRLGELDLVCRSPETLVVVEVRARGTGARCSAAESIGHRKRQRIVLATRHMLMRKPELNGLPIRFDVVAFDAIDTDAPLVAWIKNAFDAC
jgi:putative endonuclease